jgi:peptidoglycan/LPS O-acetylase OafA/YrhL
VNNRCGKIDGTRWHDGVFCFAQNKVSPIPWSCMLFYCTDSTLFLPSLVITLVIHAFSFELLERAARGERYDRHRYNAYRFQIMIR